MPPAEHSPYHSPYLRILQYADPVASTIPLIRPSNQSLGTNARTATSPHCSSWSPHYNNQPLLGVENGFGGAWVESGEESVAFVLGF